MADDATRARVGAPVGARKRRLPASVRDAARPKAKTTKAKTRDARRADARDATRTTVDARAEASPARDATRLYDVVTDDDDDEAADDDARAAARETSTSTATTLTSTAFGCVKRVTDDALVDAARAYRVAHAQATSSAPASASPPPASPPRAPPPAEPAPAQRRAASTTTLETFDDMFSMFTGAPAATRGASPAGDALHAATTSRVAAAESFVEALRARPDGATAPRAASKPKLSFAALMARDAPTPFEDSD